MTLPQQNMRSVQRILKERGNLLRDTCRIDPRLIEKRSPAFTVILYFQKDATGGSACLRTNHSRNNDLLVCNSLFSQSRQFRITKQVVLNEEFINYRCGKPGPWGLRLKFSGKA